MARRYDARVVNDPLLGAYNFNARRFDNEEVGLNEAGADIIYDKVARESGLGAEINKNLRYITALRGPEEYLNAKNADLDRINALLANEWRGEYARNLKNLKTREDSEKIATKFIESSKERYLKQHSLDFPTSIVDKVLNNGLGRGNGVQPQAQAQVQVIQAPIQGGGGQGGGGQGGGGGGNAQN
jgi:hypothetical protein